MSAHLSKAVTDRQRAGLSVLSAFAEWGAEVAALAQAIVRNDLKAGDEEPRFSASIIALGRTLKSAMERMEAADLNLFAALGRESVLRSKRRALARDLAQRIVALRRMAVAQYVAPDLEGLGLERLTRRDAIPLLRRAEVILGRTRAENLEQMLGEPRFEEPDDLRRYGVQMEPLVTALRGAVEEVCGAKREVDVVRAEKHRAMDEYDRIFLRATRMFEELCRLAGKHDLADRVRPSASRPVRTEQEAPDKAADRSTSPSPQVTDAATAVPQSPPAAMEIPGPARLPDSDRATTRLRRLARRLRDRIHQPTRRLLRRGGAAPASEASSSRAIPTGRTARSRIG